MHRAILLHNPEMMELLGDLDPAGDRLSATTVEIEMPAHYAGQYGSTRYAHTLLQCLTSVFGDLQEFEDIGTETPSNSVNKRGLTSLYVAETPSSSVNKSGLTSLYVAGISFILNGTDDGLVASTLNDHDTKMRLLLDQGAKLFSAGFLIEAMRSEGSVSQPSWNFVHLVLPVQAQRCLLMWLVEEEGRPSAAEAEGEEVALVSPEDDDTAKALTELCIQWMANVAYTGSPISLVAIVVCAGYSHEVLPLLLDLTLFRQGVGTLLRQLEKFARRGAGHVLLVPLHDELLVAWSAVETLV